MRKTVAAHVSILYVQERTRTVMPLPVLFMMSLMHNKMIPGWFKRKHMHACHTVQVPCIHRVASSINSTLIWCFWKSVRGNELMRCRLPGMAPEHEDASR